MIEVAEKTKLKEVGQAEEEMSKEIADLISKTSSEFKWGILAGLKLRLSEPIEPGADDEPADGILTELVRYVAEKFSATDRERLYRRFMIETQGKYAAHTPGNQVTREEHLSYVTKNVIEALSSYTPLHQRKVLVKYIKEVLPVADADYDDAQDEAVFAVLFGDMDRGVKIQGVISALHKVPTSKLASAKSKLKKMCDN